MATESENRSERATTALTPTEMDRVARAAALLGEREHLHVTISDVIRSGALKRADEILGVEAHA